MPEWMGAYPVATRDAAKVYNGVDVGGVINKLYGITDTIVLSDGYYVSWTGVTIAAKNIRGNGKTSNIFSICYYDDQDAVKWGNSTEIAERVSFFRPGKDFFRISMLNTVLCIMAVIYGYPSMAIRSLIGRIKRK